MDGYVSVAATTVVVPGGEVHPKLNDLINAAQISMEATLRLMRAGNKSTQIYSVLESIARDFDVSVMQNVLSHNLTRYVIDGEKVFTTTAPLPEMDIKEIEFECHEAYAVDIVLTSGSGKPRQVKDRCTVYKRDDDARYKLKSKAANNTLSEIDRKFDVFPFSLRNLESEARAKLGLKEMLQHKMVEPYLVLKEREDEIVVHLKNTVLVMPSGINKISGPVLPVEQYPSEKTVQDPEIVSLLSRVLKKKKRSKKKKNKN